MVYYILRLTRSCGAAIASGDFIRVSIPATVLGCGHMTEATQVIQVLWLFTWSPGRGARAYVCYVPSSIS